MPEYPYNHYPNTSLYIIKDWIIYLYYILSAILNILTAVRIQKMKPMSTGIILKSVTEEFGLELEFERWVGFV